MSDDPSTPPRERKPAWTAELPAYSAEELPRFLPVLEEAPTFSLRDAPEDFCVDEVPLYPATGEGEHLFLHIEKREVSTPRVVKALCRALGIKERDVGFAGRKDQRGVTRQWLSVPRAKAAAWAEGVPADAIDDGVTVLEAVPHKNKLRLGHLAGNRFSLVLRSDATIAPAFVKTLQERAQSLEEHGMPAYFGEQRFGHASESLRQAESFLARGRPARSRKETFWVSIVQSALCNAWIADRLRDGLFLDAIEGEVLLTQKGGPFWCEEPETDTRRIQAGEISPGAPMFGAKMRPARGEGMTRESRSLRALGVDPSIFETHPAFRVGERRPSRTLPSAIQITLLDGGLRVEFTLPPGAYATVLLDELVGQSVRDGAFIGP